MGTKKPEAPGLVWVSAVTGLVEGGMLAMVVAVAALLVCAALVSAGVLDEGSSRSGVAAVCVLGGLVGGLFAVHRVGQRTLLVGLGVGVLFFLLCLTLGGLVLDGPSLYDGGVSQLMACCCGGTMAGILGRKPRKKRKR